MKREKVLKPVWESYLTTIDCLKVSLRSIEKNEHYLLSKTKFIGSSIDAAKQMINDSRNNADDFVIVSLWAIFERQLIEYIQSEGKKLLQDIPNEFNTKVYIKIERDIEYWKSDDVLDVFKTIVDANLIGNAKQIKKYRDWIAHRNPNKGKPLSVQPQIAYIILTDILSVIEQSLVMSK